MANHLAVSDVRLAEAAMEDVRRGLVGYVSCVLNGSVRLEVTLRRTRKGRPAISFPTRRDAHGREHAVVRLLRLSELRTVRNEWAHDKAFSYDATYRALNTMRLLLDAVSAPEQAREVGRLEEDTIRVKFTEQRRVVERQTLIVEGAPQAGLKAWREIITPHKDVASGRYQQAEFAADLDQVHRQEGTEEYRDPREFFRRTFITQGMQHLLTSALRRISGKGGDPVVQLQTNFGGGKTHSMLALYHLFSGVTTGDLVGIEPVLKAAEVTSAPMAKRAVMVGTALAPGQSRSKPDGTVVRTLWGEMAWQLGGSKGYAMLAESDQRGTNPGKDLLTQLFRAHSPCLILIDEWVAFVRNLYHDPSLPAGSFDNNLSFAQSLTEAARACDRVLVVASLPASQIEIGGQGGKAALERLEQTFSRMESNWRPATAEEGFEIVRRRLFEPIPIESQPARDAVIRAFSEMYRANAQEFPQGAAEGSYARRLEGAYPIHPELFDRLYTEWSSLDRFQRTRGVLRLMAAVIFALWDKQDRSLLILPSSVPLDDEGVRNELTRYFEETWDGAIAKDIDGEGSLPISIDRTFHGTLGRYSAARRVARTIFMGAAPTYNAPQPGLEADALSLGDEAQECTVAVEGPGTTSPDDGQRGFVRAVDESGPGVAAGILEEDLRRLVAVPLDAYDPGAAVRCEAGNEGTSTEFFEASHGAWGG
jgi:hypothetical protein